MIFGRMTIIGVGLLGGSLAMAAKRAHLVGEVVGVGHRTSTLEEARRIGAVDSFTTDPAEGVSGADIVVFCTPVGLFGPIMHKCAGNLKEGCIITDVGSTKTEPLAALASHLPPHCHLVGGHPLAGSELRGIGAASAELFEGATVFIVPADDTAAEPIEHLERLWQAVGARTRRISAEKHDLMLARTSHLPHLTAALLAASLEPGDEQAAGKGFLDTTRVASGDPALWRDIFLTNQSGIFAALDRLESLAAQFRQALQAGDGRAIESLLSLAKRRRDSLLDQERRE